MKFFDKTTKEVYYFFDYQLDLEECIAMQKDTNFAQLPDTFDPSKQVYDPVTDTVSDIAMPTKAEIDKLMFESNKGAKLALAFDAYQTANDAPVTYKRVVYQADAASMDALATKVNAIAAGWVVPKSFQWKALDNTLHNFKAADIKSLYLSIETRNQTNWSHYQSLKTSINKCKTQKELDAIKV